MSRINSNGFSVDPPVASIFIGPLVAILFVATIVLAVRVVSGLNSATAGAWLSGQAYVIDGDTIVVRGQHVRLAGIDAPELDQHCLDAKGQSYPCGIEASAAISALTRNRDITCIEIDLDRYRRIVARCEVDGHDVGDTMVRAGHAIDYVRYDAEGRYAGAEREARGAKRGIWQGNFVQPEAWRHNR
jgi:endonuclease YncB( thermonuclease family)